MSTNSRAQDLFESIPLYTRCILAINVAVHAYVFLSSAPLGDFAISPYLVIRELQVGIQAKIRTNPRIQFIL